MQWTMEAKRRVDTPPGWSLLGAILGAIIGTGMGALLMKKALSRREERYAARGGTLERSEDLMGAEHPGFEGWDRAESLAIPTGSRIPPMPPLDDL